MNPYRVGYLLMSAIGFMVKALGVLVFAGIALLVVADAWQRSSMVVLVLTILIVVGFFCACVGAFALHDWLGEKSRKRKGAGSIK